ncbi:MAG TPA: amidohydrolase family protein [Myxococcota bacterium]|nr:amidohydrolase family protein [Myxococcota bacterium]
MSDLFEHVASIDYPILDADAHVNEPPQLWQESVPSKWKERAPKLVKTERGDLWHFDGGKETWPVGLTATAGQSAFQIGPMGQTYETMRPGSFDTQARLHDMDADGIYAQVLYPSVTLKGARVYSSERELQLVCVRAYNEWIRSFCQGSGGRLISQALIPTTGLDDAVAELERAMKDGHRGAVISSFPNGSLWPRPEDDPFWARAQETGFPIAVHIGSFLKSAPPGAATSKEKAWSPSLAFVARAAWTKAGGQTLDVACDLLFSGIFQRFPRLRIVLVEANIGWIPTLLEQADDMFRRYRWWTGAHKEMSELPSQIFQRNFYATFMVDRSGIELRHRLNLDHILWSTDYPHSGSDWPDSSIAIERVFRGVPKAEVRKMLHDNCRALYGLDHVPLRFPGRG